MVRKRVSFVCRWDLHKKCLSGEVEERDAQSEADQAGQLLRVLEIIDANYSEYPK